MPCGIHRDGSSRAQGTGKAAQGSSGWIFGNVSPLEEGMEVGMVESESRELFKKRVDVALFHRDLVGFGQRLDLMNLFQPGNGREFPEEFRLRLVCGEKDGEGIWDPDRIPEWDLLDGSPPVPARDPNNSSRG